MPAWHRTLDLCALHALRIAEFEQIRVVPVHVLHLLAAQAGLRLDEIKGDFSGKFFCTCWVHDILTNTPTGLTRRATWNAR